MLVLQRSIEESVRLNDKDGRQIGTVKVIDMDRGNVKLGFDFLPEYYIIRDDAIVTVPKSREVGNA